MSTYPLSLTELSVVNIISDRENQDMSSTFLDVYQRVDMSEQTLRRILEVLVKHNILAHHNERYYIIAEEDR